jgi:hypothetical protein
MNDIQHYEQQLKQFVSASVGKEPKEMRALVIEFLPTFIAKTTEDIRIGEETRDHALAELRKLEARITLHGESRRDRKQREKIVKLLKHNESLFDRVKAQVDHWESMRIAFNITLPEIAGMSDSVTADSSLSSLYPQLYSDNAL